MKFWIVTCTVEDTDEKFEFTVASDEKTSKEQLKKDLKSVWPEYKKISVKKGRRPENWTLFEGVR